MNATNNEGESMSETVINATETHEQSSHEQYEAVTNEPVSDNNSSLTAERTHPVAAFFISLFATLLAGSIITAFLIWYFLLCRWCNQHFSPGIWDLSVLLYFLGSALPSFIYIRKAGHSSRSMWWIGIACLLASISLFSLFMAFIYGIAGMHNFH